MALAVSDGIPLFRGGRGGCARRWAQFIPGPVPGSPDDSSIGLPPWMMDRLGEPLGLDDLAREAHMSVRGLTRHFQSHLDVSPRQWLPAQRMSRAQELLETTDDSVEQIAERTGTGTATSLRRRFNRRLGVSPPRTARVARGRCPGAATTSTGSPAASAAANPA